MTQNKAHLYPICSGQVVWFDPLQNGGYVVMGLLNHLHPDDPLEDLFFVCLFPGVDNPGAIDQVDSSHQGDVLPHFGFPCQGSHLAYLLGPKQKGKKLSEMM